MYMAQKAKKKSKLRHAEYYDMQKTFDSLYAGSKSGEVFGHLMDTSVPQATSSWHSEILKAMMAVIPQARMGGQ